MLQLNDDRWSGLVHAYGAASNVPMLLRRLEENPRQMAANDEPWFTLWSSLCHQGDVYSASYAAVPHIVRIALSAPGPVDFSFFLLPASVDVARLKGPGPEIPEFLRQAYDDAIQGLADCAAAHLSEAWGEDLAIAATAAVAVSKGHHQLAEAVMNLDHDWIAKINNGDWD
ncbi:hypothetical protein [Caulobacter sp. SSI4214]|uniref:hypothetical protein n=1 Tax=Caulobacter sp. SSI4214 TaxID=2575739 RepID=UPI00143AD3DD|nr:hypothetical protein [Caulobacter sp. SSI4214]